MTWGNSTTDTKNFMLFLCMHMHLPFSEQRNYSGSQPFYIYMYLQKTDRLDTFFCFRELIIVEIGIGYQFYKSVCFPINFLSVN